MQKLTFLYPLIFMLIVRPVLGQESSVLESYIRQGLNANLTLQQQQSEVSKAVQSVRQARALFYPQVTFAPTYSLAYGGRRLAFPVGDMLNPLFAAINDLTGRQDFPTDVENINELLAPHNFHDTKVSFQVPLYSPEVKYNYLIQNSLLSASEARLRVVREEIVYAIQEAYYQYLQALQVKEIYLSARTSLRELVRLNQKLVENQVITRDAVLAAEYELSSHDQQLAEIEKNVQLSKSYFNYLLNRDLAADIEVDTLNGSQRVNWEVDLQDLTALALTGRQELKTWDFSLRAAQNATQLEEKMATRPTLFVGGNTGFQGYHYKFSDQGYFIAQVGLRWDLFKGGERKARIAQAQIQEDLIGIKRTEAEKRIGLEVAQAYFAAQASLEGLKVADAALEKARAYYKVVNSRYQNQQVLYIEYIKALDELRRAEIQQVLSRYEVLIRKAHLDRVTGLSETQY